MLITANCHNAIQTLRVIPTMSKSIPHAPCMIFLTVLVLVNTVLADCECGYTANVNSSNTTEPTTWLFTDVLESDFFHIDNITLDTDWYAQNYSMTPEAAQGPFGVYTSPSFNVFVYLVHFI